MLGELVGEMRFAGYDFLRKEAEETLADVVVWKKGVLEYCDKFGVRPPLCVTGYPRWLFSRSARFAAPPRYPATPDEIAEEERRLKSEKEAETAAQIASLQQEGLENLKGLLKNIEDMSNTHEEQVWNYWYGIWHGEKELFEAELESLPDGKAKKDLENRLHELAAELQDLGARNRGHSASDPKSSRTSTVAAETQARRYLKKQVQDNNWQPKDYHFEQAKEQIGEQLSKRAFLRAWDDIAPEEWRKKGRRRRSDG